MKKIFVAIASLGLMAGLATPASASPIDFVALESLSGKLMLTKNVTYDFIACSKTRDRLVMFRKQGTTWQQVARAHMVKDGSGKCDMDFPYLSTFTWRVNTVPKKVQGMRSLRLGVGKEGSVKPFIERTVGIYANNREASAWMREVSEGVLGL